MIDPAQAEAELSNWGRCLHDGWLRDNLLYTPPPTSDGYRAEIVAYDDPEPVRPPCDELAAQRTEEVVVQIGLQDFDSYRVLAYWYPHLLLIRIAGTELSNSEAIKRLSKHMHTSFPGAQRMLDQARVLYRQLRG